MVIIGRGNFLRRLNSARPDRERLRSNPVLLIHLKKEYVYGEGEA